MSKALSYKDAEAVPTLKDLFPALLRQWKIVGSVFVLVTVIAAYTLTRGKTYTANGQVLLKSPTSSVQIGPTAQSIADLHTSQTYPIATQQAMLANDELKRKLAAKLGGEVLRSGPSTIFVGNKSVTLSVVNPQESEIVTVAGVSTDPTFAAKGVNGLMQAYIDELYDAQFEELKSQASKLGGLVVKTKKKLNQARENVRALQNEFGAVDNTTSLTADVANMTNLETADSNARSAMDAARATFVELERASHKIPRIEPSVPKPEADPSIQALEAQYNAAVSERDALKGTYTDANPQMQALNARVESIKRNLDQEMATFSSRNNRYSPERKTIDGRVSDAQADYRAKEAAAAALDGKLAAAKARLKAYPAWTEKYATATATVDREAQNLSNEEAQISEIETREKTIVPGSEILTAASVPVQEDGGKSSMIGLVALLGLIVGCIVGILADRSDDRLRADSLLGSITRLGVIVVPDRSEPIITELGILTARNVLARLRVAFSEGQSQRIVVAAISSPEDQAVAVASLALAGASIGLSVAIVVPSASGKKEDVGFQIDKLVSASGLSESWRIRVLGPGAEVAIAEVSRNHSSPEVQAQLTVVTAPPVNDLAGFASAAGHDGVILVGRSNADTKRALFASLDELDNVGAYIKGFVLLEPMNANTRHIGKDVQLVAALGVGENTHEVVRAEK